ncbi:uncharacterized protein V1513DRAFT_450589 [Lipomyces chichibuensis]|uniref:uncharacterized protein n=1 Tax=Lipomyces chichibuensis TaxID=1546026 RepID=UPI003343E708
MKFGIAAIVLALLVAPSQADVWYWCTGDGRCDNAPGVGPTYVCGKKFWDYYDSGRKRWRTSRDTLSDNFWKTGGFYDCCHDSGKGACYDIENE